MLKEGLCILPPLRTACCTCPCPTLRKRNCNKIGRHQSTNGTRYGSFCCCVITLSDTNCLQSEQFIKMAQALNKELDPCNVSCAICLEPLKDPATISCGHSFCMSCISGCWDQEERREGVYSCPQCRKTFTPRPVLNKNTVLAELMEKLNLRKVRPDHDLEPHHAGPGDVECDVCTGRKLKAVKSCLVCLVSYCETHVQPHYQSAAFQWHKLTHASSKLHENICSQHNRLLEVYCRSDGRCVCVLCTMDEHRGHDTISATAARTEKQKHFEGLKNQSQTMIEQRSSELLKIKEAFLAYKEASLLAEQHCTQTLRQLCERVQWTHSAVMQEIGDQQVAAVSQAEEALEGLETEMAELRRREEELDKLSHEDDLVRFLQTLQFMPTSYERKVFKAPHLSFEPMKKSLCELKSAVERACAVVERDVLKSPMCSVTERAGLCFSVDRVMSQLCTSTPEDHYSIDAAVCLAAVIEYLTAEIMELSGNEARDDGKEIIAPRHIKWTIARDEEIKQFLRKIYIPEGERRETSPKNTNHRKGTRRIRVKPKHKLMKRFPQADRSTAHPSL